MTTHLPTTQAMQELCKLTKQWGLYIGWCVPDDVSIQDVIEAAPYLKESPLLYNDGGIILGTKEEIQALFEVTVGDEGPTKTNSYSGKARVYALTCGPDGRFMNENT